MNGANLTASKEVLDAAEIATSDLMPKSCNESSQACC